MNRWVATIRGFTSCLSDDGSPDGVREAAAKIVSVLKPYSDNQRWKEMFGEDAMFDFEDIIGTIETDGEDGELGLVNYDIDMFYNWCDTHRVWVDPTN